MPEATTPKRRRPRGEGSIYQTEDGRWRASIIVENPASAARKRHVIRGRDFDEVKAKLRALRRDVEDGRPVTGKPVTVAQYAKTWLPPLEGRVRRSTYLHHESLMRLRIIPTLGHVALRDITPTAVERMTTAMIAGTGPAVSIGGKPAAVLPKSSPTTARAARGTLRMMLADAMRDGIVLRNAASLARPPRPVRHELRVLSVDETKTLIAATEEGDLGPIIALSATTGLRQGEALGLRWSDVDLEAAILTVRRAYSRSGHGTWADAEPKTARSRRTIDLPAVAVSALRREKVRQMKNRLAAGAMWQDTAGCVFTDALGRRVTGNMVAHAFSRELERLGLPHVRWHDLRHGAASMMLGAGVPLKTVSETLGHSGIAITADVYGHMSAPMRREAASALDRVIGGEE